MLEIFLIFAYYSTSYNQITQKVQSQISSTNALPKENPSDDFGKCGQNVNYTFTANNETLTIFGNGDMDSYDNFSMTPWNSYKDYIRTLIVEVGVSTINGNCFANCSNLEYVSIPHTIDKIYKETFYNCTSLTTVLVDSNVSYIYGGAFGNCINLNSFYYTGSKAPITYEPFEGCEKLKSVYVSFDYKLASFDGFPIKRNFGYGKLSTTIKWSMVASLGELNITGSGDLTGNKDIRFIPWNGYFTYVTKLLISEGITSIGINMFNGCNNIINITLPESIISIGSFSFANCNNMTLINFPKKLKTIGYGAFMACNSLKTIILDEQNPNYKIDNGVIFSKNGTVLILYPPGKTDSQYTIPDNVTTVYRFAFCNCTSLKSITITKNVILLDNYSFSSTGVETMYIPDGVKNISHHAFEHSLSLYAIFIEQSVTFIGFHCFEFCSSLKAVYYNGLTPPASSHFCFTDANRFSRVFLPTAYKSNDHFFLGKFWANCFVVHDCGSNCKSIANNYTKTLAIYGTGSMKNSQPYSFFSSIVTKVIVMDGITRIGKAAFRNFQELDSVNISDTVTEIDEDAFTRCTKLNNITLPKNLESLGSCAFGVCTNLKSIYLPEKLSSIGMSPFYGCISLTVDIDENNNYFKLKNGILYSNNSNQLVFYHPNKIDSHYEMPNEINSIDPYAFYDCKYLKSISIPNNVQSIGEKSFQNCISLKSIFIPKSINEIRSATFQGCSNLEKVEIEGQLNNINLNAFEDCIKLSTFIYNAEFEPVCKNIFYNDSSLKYVTVRMIYKSDTFGGKEARKLYDCGSCGEKVNWYYDNIIFNLRIYGSENMLNYSNTSSPQWHSYASLIKSIDIENGVNSIGDYSFIDCNNTVLINISESVNLIGKSAFYSCNSLQYFKVNENNTKFKSVDGILFSKDETILVSYPIGRSTSSITIPHHVAIIREHAFALYPNLTELNIGKSVTFIGEYAFYNCSKLKAAKYFGSTEPLISSTSFEGCNNLNEIKVPTNYENKNFGLVSPNKCFVFGECGENAEWIFDFQTSNLTIFGFGEMYNYSSSLRPQWDSHKTLISYIIVENGITSISNYMCIDYINLSYVIIPESLSTFGICSFISCSSMQSFIVSKKNANFISVKNVLYTKNYSNIISYPAGLNNPLFTIPDNVTSINQYAFSNCSSLNSIKIGLNVTFIGDNAFHNCINLNSIIYCGLEDPMISTNYFEGCQKLEKIQVQLEYKKEKFGIYPVEKQFAIGKINADIYWIYNNTNATLEILGNGKIPDYPDKLSVPWAKYQELVKKISISTLITEIGDYSFAGCCLITTFHITSGIKSVGFCSFPISSSFQFFTSNYGSNYNIFNNILFNKDTTTLICYPSGKNDTSYKIPYHVDNIYQSAFANCTYLTSITIESDVNYIRKNAFFHCSNLKELYYYGLNVPSYIDPAFEGCSNLTFVKVQAQYKDKNFGNMPAKFYFDIGYCGGNVEYKYIESNLTIYGFQYTYNYNWSYSPPWDMYNQLITHVVIQDGVTKLGDYLLRSCTNIISISFPKSFKELGNEALPLTSPFLENIIVDEENQYFKVKDGCLLTKHENVFIRYPPTKVDETYRIPDNVTKIFKYAFSGCLNLISLEIGANMTNFGNFAIFYCTNLTSLYYYGNENPSFYANSIYQCDKLKFVFVLPSYESETFFNMPIKIFYPITSIPITETLELPTLSSIQEEDSQIESQSSLEEETSDYNPIPTPEPIIEIIESVSVPEDANEQDLEKILNETFNKMLNTTNSNKIIVVDSSKISFNSNLENDQFIKPKVNSEIDYNGGKLNLILPNSGQVTVSIINDDANLSINGEGEIKINPKNSQSDTINLISNSQINGSVKITVPNGIESVTMDSIELKKDGSIVVQNEDNLKKINLTVKDISAQQNSKATISNLTVLNSINVVQTATINLDNVTLDKAVINIEIFNFGKENNIWNPFFKGNFNNPPKKLILTKVISSGNDRPIINEEYTLASGLFEEKMCENWLNIMDYGNSQFNRKICEDNQMLSSENKRIIIKSVEQEKSKGKLNGGQIAGIVIGCIAGVAIITIAVIFIIKKLNNRDMSEGQNP